MLEELLMFVPHLDGTFTRSAFLLVCPFTFHCVICHIRLCVGGGLRADEKESVRLP